MNKWTRLQDKIATLRILSVILLLIFSCIFTWFLVRSETTTIILFKYLTRGIITDYETLKQDGIANHHLQYAELSGWMRYDAPLDFVTEHNHVVNRLIVLQDPITKYAVIVGNQPMYGIWDEEEKNISGMIRKMDDEMYDIFTRDIGSSFDEMEADGWTIEPRYYINEHEGLPDGYDLHNFLVFGVVNLLLIMITIGLVLVPHPRTIKDMSKYERKLHTS